MKIDIFLVGLATMPFDNLSFAPSRGWATISPIIFFAYCFMNLHLLIKVMTKNHLKTLLYITGAMLFQSLLLCIYGVHFYSFIDSLRTLVLGVTIYFAMLIRYQICHHNIDLDAEVLYKAYIISFLYGLVWLVMNRISPDNTYSIFTTIQKRTYNRLAYTFTEPSFITMHTIGVMFMFVYLVHNKELAVKFVRLSVAFMMLSIFNASSTRCATDAAMLLLLSLLRMLSSPPPPPHTHKLHSRHSTQSSLNTKLRRSIRVNRKPRLKRVFVSVAMIFGIILIFSLSSRLDNVVNKGANSDSSMASRWFRVNASLQGFAQNGIETIAGWGMGNMIIPFRYGYNSALKDFDNSYTSEVDNLGRAKEVDSLFSLPIKIISEWGLVVTLYIFLYMLSKTLQKRIDIYFFLQICWLYVQTDSYCFYTMWMFLYLVNYYDPNRNGVSVFDIIS